MIVLTVLIIPGIIFSVFSIAKAAETARQLMLALQVMESYEENWCITCLIDELDIKE